MSIDVPHDHVTNLLTEEDMFCLEGCGSYTQYHLMRQGFERGNCAFCQLDRKRNEVLWEDKYFMLWEVPAGIGKKHPLEHHILIVPKRHVRFVADLMYKEAISLIKANRYARDMLGYSGGLNHAREGDMRNNAGTVPHLHWNLFEPDGTVEVRVPVLKNPTDRAEIQLRSARFAAIYGYGITPDEFVTMVEEGVMSTDGQRLPKP